MNAYLAEPSCTGTLVLSLDSDGEVASELAPGDPCLGLEVSEQEVSEDATQEVSSAVEELAETCAKGCDSQLRPSDESLQSRAEGCEPADFIWFNKDPGGKWICWPGQGVNAVSGNADLVDLTRVVASDAVSSLSITPLSEPDTLELTLTAYECIVL